MSKKHDESKDLRCIAPVASIDSGNKTIYLSKSAIIGNTRWGRIDYLQHYCGWHVVRNNEIIVNRVNKDDDKVDKRKVKRDRKAPKLTDKRKR